MDIIKIAFEDSFQYETVDFKGYNLTLSLNDEVFKNQLLNFVEVLCLIDLHFAEFDLFTCSCGIPGCAGYHYSVLQTVEDGIVTWTFPESGDYKTKKKVYRFDLIAFKKVLKETIKQVKSLEKEKIYHSLLVRDDSDYVDYEDDGQTAKYSIRNKFIKEFKYIFNSFHGRQNYYDMLHENYPDLVNKNFNWIYDNELIKSDISFDDLVCNILNQYPSKEHEPYFIAKCKLSVKAIRDLLKGDNRLFKKLTKHGYGKYDLSAYDVVEYYIRSKVKEEDFIIDKLSLNIKD